MVYLDGQRERAQMPPVGRLLDGLCNALLYDLRLTQNYNISTATNARSCTSYWHYVYVYMKFLKYHVLPQWQVRACASAPRRPLA